MKKSSLNLIVILTLLAMLLAFPTTRVAAKSDQASITLISAQYIPGKGVVYKFQVKGDFNSFDGVVTIDGKTVKLSCAMNEFGDLVCMGDKSLKEYMGHFVTATVNGFTSGGVIRDTASQYCYSIWDYWGFTENQWAFMGTHCQDNPAAPGDYIQYTVPDPNGTFPGDAWFFDSGIDACAPEFGSGYYWDSCGFFEN